MNKDVEIAGRSALRTFKYGVTSYILETRRIDGSWHIAMSHTLHIALSTSVHLQRSTKRKLTYAFKLLFRVYAGLQLPLLKSKCSQYQKNIDDLLSVLVEIHMPFSLSDCKSIKFHWPRHWVDTRRTLGCAAHEKSLERKLAETQKKNFKFTNQNRCKEVRVLWPFFAIIHAFSIKNLTLPSMLMCYRASYYGELLWT